MSARDKSGKRAQRAAGEPHVRLYLWELKCPAYRALSPAARALLVDLRSLYRPLAGNNRVFRSIRDMMKSCNLTQRAATRARDELIAKGWIKMVQLGAFQTKVRHATEFTLENEPPNDSVGTSLASKAYMTWQPSQNVPTAITMKKNGSRIGYRSVVDSTTEGRTKPRKMTPTVVDSTTDHPSSELPTVVDSTTQIGIPMGVRSGSVVPAVDPSPAPALASGANRRKST